MAKSTPASTRERIVSEASRLFAAQGIKATTVAQIEAAVGLRKGSGGVHRYFATKNDLVEEVFESQLRRGREVLAEAKAIPVPDASDAVAYLTAVGEKILRDAEVGREVSLIMLRDAANLPDSARRQRLENDEIAYGATAELLRTQMSPEQLKSFDPEALSFLFVGSLIYFKLSEWLSDEPKLGISHQRLIRTWVNVFAPVLSQFSATSTGGGEP
jgi:AcrR family transcriptional regulator